jgi:hypothetical protein
MTQVYAYFLQQVAVPEALIQISYDFKARKIRPRNSNVPISSMTDMCFRLLNLRAAIKNSENTDAQAIREAALELDSDLDTFSTNVPSTWKHTAIDISDDPVGDIYFNGVRHLYSDLWTAKVWNHWRTLRILVNQIIVQTEGHSVSVLSSAQSINAHSIIHQLSIDICISTSSFIGSPRKCVPLFRRQNKTEELYQASFLLSIRFPLYLKSSSILLVCVTGLWRNCATLTHLWAFDMLVCWLIRFCKV